MRIAHAELVHVVQRVADVIDARPALADPLGDEPSAAVQVELAHVGRMRRVGNEGEGSHAPAAAHPRRDQAGRVDPARHFPLPKAGEAAPDVARWDPKGHSPARPAGAKPHDQPGFGMGAAVAGGQDAERAVVAMHPR